MKQEVKLWFVLLVNSCPVAAVVYPLLHELGHVVVSVLFAVPVCVSDSVGLPSVLCLVEPSQGTAAAVAIGGLFLPTLVGCCLHPKRFFMCYAVFVLRLINLFAVVLAYFSVFSFLLGYPMPADDMTAVLSVDRSQTGELLFGIGLCMTMTLTVFAGDKEMIKRLWSEWNDLSAFRINM